MTVARLNKEQIICVAVTVAVVAALAFAAIGAAAFAGGGDAYLDAEPSDDVKETDTPVATDGGDSTGSNNDFIPPPPVSGSEGEKGTTAPDLTGDVQTGDIGTEPTETVPGAGPSLGGLDKDDPPAATTYETWIVVIPPETSAEQETTLEPETTAPVTEPPEETDPVVTDPVVTDPVVTDPVETDPVETDPVVTDPPETDPPETDPHESTPIEGGGDDTEEETDAEPTVPEAQP